MSDVSAEESVIGGVLVDPILFDDAQWLRPEMFQGEYHCEIWQAITEADKKDPISVIEHSPRMQELQGVILELSVKCASTANFEHYAGIVRDKYLIRETKSKLLEVCQNHNGHDHQSMMADVESVISSIESGGDKHDNVNTIFRRTLEGIEERFKSEGALCGLSSGLRDLDDLVGGYGDGHLVIVAGRPKMGKTTFLINAVCDALKKRAGAVAVFSLEMTEDELMQKIVSCLGGINSEKIRSGRLTDDDWQKLTNAAAIIKDSPLHLIAKPGMQLGELKAKAKKLARSENIALIGVDYLQLVRVPTAKSRLEEVSEVSRQLKELGGDVSAPVMALSQLNRSLESRPDKRPVPSDLRDSGTIEQDADTMLFPYRDEVYNADTDDKGVAEIGVVARHGRSGRVRVAADMGLTSFKNLDHNHIQG